MKTFFYLLFLLLFFPMIYAGSQTIPDIRDITYIDIQTYSVRIIWKTNIPADSKVRWMISDSNYQAISYTDSLYSPVLDTLHSVTLTFLNPNTMYNFNVSSAGNGGTNTSQNMMFATQSANLSTINVYFSKSVDTTVANGIIASGNVDLVGTLLNRIDNSGYYIDASVSYFEDQQDIVDALVKAKQNGVVIRFIYDGKQNTNWIDTLIAHGIKIIKRKNDNVNGHCLNTNFWVFDSRCTCSGDDIFVWTSSAQLRPQSLSDDKNYAVEIKDRMLAYVYTREFDEMWGSFGDNPDTAQARFGSFKKDNIPHLLNLNSVLTEVYFAPSDSVDRNMNDYLSKSNSGIFFSAYDFKSQAVYNNLYRLRQGRHVRGIFDLSKSGSGVFSAMKSWADVWIDSSAGKLQHSYFITDPVTNSPRTGVITGSYSWTPESNLYNDEDVLIFHSPVIANQFYQEFHQRYKEASGHPVMIQNISSGIPGGYKLYQNYPNPFNPTTRIRFSIPLSSEIQLEVYNTLGQKISTLASGKYNAGTYEVIFGASDLPSGVYICRLSSGKLAETSKMILIK